MKLHLLIIDPQNDFCDPAGALYVRGADDDMKRLAGLIDRLGDRIEQVHVTLDAHHRLDISHPLWWRDEAGEHPRPFTTITAAEVRAGRWRTSRAQAHDRSLAYLEALEARGRYPHLIWPEHCLIGDRGHDVLPVLSEAVHRWERGLQQTHFVYKGMNPWTEHFSAVQAEVPDPDDAATQVQRDLVRAAVEADLLLIAGEARSHCVANTVRDLLAQLPDPALVRKLVLLTDAMSDVGDLPGTSTFRDLGERFVRDLVASGARTATTAAFEP
jgi:nicotinamidase/pyrazinamidase